MSKASPKTPFVFSAVIAFLMFVASTGGLLINGLYRDNTLVKTLWYGNDFVTLLIALPVLIVSLIFSFRGSTRAQLVWYGVLDYTLYNYVFYLFAAAFNYFFLIYVGLVSLSILALIFCLSGFDINDISKNFQLGKKSAKIISLYMVFLAVMLGGLWISQSLSFVFTGRLPQFVLDTAHPTAVVFAIDLTLVVPFLILGGIWLWKDKSWGYVLAVIVNIKGALYTFVLAVNSILAAKIGFPGALSQIPLWSFLTLVSLLVCLAMLKSLTQKYYLQKGV